MSWFDAVKNVTKAVARGMLDVTSVTAGAVSDNHPGFWSILNQPSTSTAHSEDQTNVSTVTTRARFTYELYRFRKNAMLMFVQIRSDPPAGGRVEESTTQDINALLDTFTCFRFEITTHIDLTCSEIDNKCREFFQQDFQEYGAVAVIVLTFEGASGQLSALDGTFSESIILRHLTNDLNPSLLAKPRIYITEANRIISPDNLISFSIPLGDHQDVLSLHLPTLDYGATIQRPLLSLCDNINKMADTNDLVTILKKSIEDLEKEAQSISGNRPIEFSNNFTKEMMLARS